MATSIMYLPEQKKGIFVFKALDASDASVYRYLTLGWRFTDTPGEPWTTRFNEFKAGEAKAINAACKVAPKIFDKAADVLGDSVTVVSAHGHGDVKLDVDCGVARLAAAMAERHGWDFAPDALRHKAHDKLSKPGLSGVARERLISGTYTCRRAIKTDRILIVDDFVTRGSTVREIASALIERNPKLKVYGFALGKTERLGYANDNGYVIGNGHLPERALKAWKLA